VRTVVEDARGRFEASGARVEEVDLDLPGVDEAFETLRAIGFVRRFGPQLDHLRRDVKDTIVWNVERGLVLDGEAVARAIGTRGDTFRAVAAILSRYDVIAAPAAQVAPFDAEIEYPVEVDGAVMPHYLGWMRACSRITVSAHPVVAVPGGFTADGLPVGLQLVGRHRGDRRLLEIAAAWETATGLTACHPPLPE
jgi:amidase